MMSQRRTINTVNPFYTADFSTESLELPNPISITTKKNKKCCVDYKNNCFIEDAIVTGRDLPPNSLFSIYLRNNTSSSVCTIFYQKDPSFKFEIQPKTYHNEFKRTITRKLRKHGLKVVGWQPSLTNKKLNVLLQENFNLSSISNFFNLNSRHNVIRIIDEPIHNRLHFVSRFDGQRVFRSTPHSSHHSCPLCRIGVPITQHPVQ